MLKNTILFVFLYFVALKSFSQEITVAKQAKIIPKSIYSQITTSSNFNAIVNLNERLKLNSYKFVYINEKNIENGYFTVPLNTTFKATSKFSLDTYKKIKDRLELEKSFFKVSKLYEPFQYLNDLQKKRFR